MKANQGIRDGIRWRSLRGDCPAAGTVVRREWDDAARSIETIQNYKEDGSGTDENVTTRTTYTPDGNVATLTAVNPVTGDQTTQYLYGTTLENSAVNDDDR